LNLSSIKGQERAVASLLAALASRRMHHAWLFTGPAGSGKRTTAMALAAAANCESPALDGDACGACPSCRMMARGMHPDMHTVACQERIDSGALSGHVLTIEEAEQEHKENREAAGREDESSEDAAGEGAGESAGGKGDRRMIKIEVVRLLERYMNDRAMQGRYKVALVVDADRMNPSAANAILKTLEEPPGDSLIMLTSAAPSSLLPTVRSRCQTVRFSALDEGLVARELCGRYKAGAEEAGMLAHLSDGSLGRAVALKDSGQLDWTLEQVGAIAAVPSMTVTDALFLAEQIGKATGRGEGREKLLCVLDIMGIYYRDAAACAWSGGWEAAIGAKQASPETAIACFGLLEAARRELGLYLAAQVVLESLFLKMRSAVREVR